jgi:hypothetical protein
VTLRTHKDKLAELKPSHRGKVERIDATIREFEEANYLMAQVREQLRGYNDVADASKRQEQPREMSWTELASVSTGDKVTG